MTDKKRSRLRPLVELALVAALIVGLNAWKTRHVPRGPIAPLAGPGLDGELLSTDALRGRPALVHFWATWCGVCRAEEGTIVSLAGKVPMLTVASSSGDAAAVKAYLAARGVKLPVLVDPEGTLAARYGVDSFPTTLVLDENGVVRSVTVGYTTWVGLWGRILLAKW